MILYLDTSSLLKLYVEEEGTHEVKVRADAADHVATSIVAYPEAQAAVARRHREGALDKRDYETIIDDLRTSWFRLLVVFLSLPVAMRAGTLAARFGLRGMDSIHLASYAELFDRGDVEFLSHDSRLRDAASTYRRRHRSTGSR